MRQSLPLAADHALAKRVWPARLSLRSAVRSAGFRGLCCGPGLASAIAGSFADRHVADIAVISSAAATAAVHNSTDAAADPQAGGGIGAGFAVMLQQMV